MFLSKAHFSKIVVSILISCFFFSCVSTKKSVYFYNLPDTVMTPVKGNLESVIQKGDIVQIVVSSMNTEDVAMYNTPSMASTGLSTSAQGPQAVGFLVNNEGYINYPVLGQIKAAGLTKTELTKYLHDQFIDKKLLVDPVVSIRFLNYRVTVLGEVGKPGVINVNSERITMLEALGMAGDITVYGKKENVMLIREEDGTRTVKRLDLNSREIFSSPYYYLHTNDIVYVEPKKAKVASSERFTQTLPIVISVLSILVIALDRILR